MNTIGKNSKVTTLVCVILFLSIFYRFAPFSFGYSNNVEELPLIYKLMGIAEYQNDDFVNYHTSHYTQVTPYITLISLLGNVFQVRELTLLFFILHVLTILLLYLSIREIHKQTSNAGDIAIFFSITSLIFFLERLLQPVIPNGRNLLLNFLDPELVTFAFLFFTVAFYIAKKYKLSYLYLAISTILHPLNALPILAALLISTFIQVFRKKIRKYAAIIHSTIYIAAAIPYTFYLWIQSRQLIQSTIDTSMISEVIRAPHHSVIRTLIPPSFSYTEIRFFIYSIGASLIGIFLLRYVSINSELFDSDFVKNLQLLKFHLLFKRIKETTENHNIKLRESLIELIIINFSLISTLLTTSLIASFARIPLLIQLTPYRIGVVVVVLSWIVVVSSLMSKLERNAYYRLNKVGKPFLSAGIVVVLLLSSNNLIETYNNSLPEKKLSSPQREVVSWIKNNTSESDLFLDYSRGMKLAGSIIDIRTNCLRPVYFNFKTYPLTADSQLLWYEKFRIYQDIPETISSHKYSQVKDYATNEHSIKISRVLKNSGAPIKYILVLKEDNNYTYELDNLNLVFENNVYKIFKQA